MLTEPDDVQIQLVAQGLVTLMGADGAARELRRLYGRQRAIEAMRHAMADRNAAVATDVDVVGVDQDGADVDGVDVEVDVVIDLAEPQPLTIDLRDGQIPSAVRQPSRTLPTGRGWTSGSGALPVEGARPAPKVAARRAVSAYAQRPSRAGAPQRPDRTFWM